MRVRIRSSHAWRTEANTWRQSRRCYRVLKTEQLLAHRGRATPAHRARPRAYVVTAPRTLFSWDITYVPSSIRGQYYYLYLFMDVFSRKAVGAEVHAEESMAHSSQLLETICRAEGIEPHQVSVHADNGGAMKGSTMLATMQRLGVDALVQSPVGQQRQSVF